MQIFRFRCNPTSHEKVQAKAKAKAKEREREMEIHFIIHPILRLGYHCLVRMLGQPSGIERERERERETLPMAWSTTATMPNGPRIASWILWCESAAVLSIDIRVYDTNRLSRARSYSLTPSSWSSSSFSPKLQMARIGHSYRVYIYTIFS